MALSKRVYAAVRRDTYDGHEWLDTGSLGPDPMAVRQQNALDERSAGPSWAKTNPVLRIVPVEVRELEETNG